MIITETRIINGIQYDYTYSDLNVYIERDGVPYTDALDPLGSGRTYIETNIPLEPELEPTVEDKAEAYDILMGVVS